MEFLFGLYLTNFQKDSHDLSISKNFNLIKRDFLSLQIAESILGVNFIWRMQLEKVLQHFGKTMMG